MVRSAAGGGAAGFPVSVRRTPLLPQVARRSPRQHLWGLALEDSRSSAAGLMGGTTMQYTGRRVAFTAREREDGQWRLSAWVNAAYDSDEDMVPVQHAWKVKPLSFESQDWQLLALLQEAVKYVSARNEESVDPEDPDQLDLWGDV